MKHSRRNIVLLFLASLLAVAAAGCSNKGIHMPKHRKRRHCNCPTFTENISSPSNASIARYESI
ncbi:MAG: hypothetical protein MJZ67_03745 [Bacteroidales bacterium]|nr:hypothetical protein [Bacteroidales bacterium]